MLQESVYCKLALNQTSTNTIYDNLRRNKPIAGVVQVMSITEKQFSNTEFLVGESSSDIIDSDERLLVL
jgi:CRISPR-associated protein Cas2